MKKRLSTLVLLSAIMLFAVGVFGCAGSGNDTKNTVDAASANQEMAIHFIDVGQGDAIFIDYGEYEALIDGGNRKDGKFVADYIRPYVDGAIELIVATHGDADHIGGLIDVAGSFEIDMILHNGEKRSTATFRDFDGICENKNNTDYKAADNATIIIDDYASLQIITPIQFYTDYNENSVVTELTYGDITVLFTGDMEKKSEKDLIGRFSGVNVLKSSHHGSRTSSTAEFLNIVKPEYVIISCGLDNMYNHPHSAALKRYFDIGASVYGTHKDGTIIMTTDGKTYSIDAASPLTLADAGDVKKSDAIYIGNKSSKKFHYPTCQSVKQIAEKNMVAFYSASETAGYTPCAGCGPE